MGPCGGTPTDAPVQLLENPWASNAVWSPDCRHIAYDGGGALGIANRDGTGVRGLFNKVGSSPHRPAWSPDGSKIAFVVSTRTDPFDDANPHIQNRLHHIWTVNSDGSNPIKLTSGKVEDDNPTWSADGRKLAFERNSWEHNEWYIVVMDSDGKNPVDLNRKFGGGTEPAWSPDGSQIAFNWSGSLAVMDADGTNATRLPPDDNRGGRLPTDSNKLSWSPDGTRLAFSLWETRDGRVVAGESNIAILEIDTGEITQVTSLKGREINPDWSPDGQRILFNSVPNSAGQSHVFVVGAERSVAR